MTYIEMILLMMVVSICLYMAVADIRTGLIPNKVLLPYLLAGCIINTIYYGVFQREYVILFLENLVVTIAISFILYGIHIWSAGDSKLLIIVVFLLPIRIVWPYANTIAPAVYLMMIVFSVGYLFLIGEAIALDVRSKSIGFPKPSKFSLQHFGIELLKGLIILTAWNGLASSIFPTFYSNNVMLMSFVSFFLISILREDKIYNKCWLYIACGIIDVIIIVKSAQWITAFSVAHLIVNYIIIGVVMITTLIAGKYTYAVIPTSSVRPRMILSQTTVSQFMLSRVQNLPDYTFEDMRSRLTDEQADAVRRWESSKYGMQTVTIVKKIPFAAFIAVGTAIEVCIGIVIFMEWR